jgi:hypothetical protein
MLGIGKTEAGGGTWFLVQLVDSKMVKMRVIKSVK